MRVLVTGANGHIGCNLVRELLARDPECPFLGSESPRMSDIEGGSGAQGGH